MGTPMVIEVQMLLKGLVDVGHLQFPGVEVPELTAGGGVSASGQSYFLGCKRRKSILLFDTVCAARTSSSTRNA